MILTREMFEGLKTASGGFTRATIEALGLEWNQDHNRYSREQSVADLIGKRIDHNVYLNAKSKRTDFSKFTVKQKTISRHNRAGLSHRRDDFLRTLGGKAL